MKNLAEISKEEQLEFINSFDHVLCDLDGVVWLVYQPIAGAPECINYLKQLGKKVHYVSNNSTMTVEFLKNNLEDSGLVTDVDDIAVPILAIISYLKKINFEKELYVLAVSVVKEALRKAGFSLAADGPQEIPENFQSIAANTNDNRNVGGVLVDVDININLIKLQKAITYLSREDCIFITAANDAKIPLGNTTAIGPYYFMQPIIEITGREPHRIGKPYVSYNEFIVDTFKITDPQRVLFIGDSVKEDLNFATKCGYQKLLVLSGVTKRNQLNNWEHPEEYKPQYYVESLYDFKKIISKP